MEEVSWMVLQILEARCGNLVGLNEVFYHIYSNEVFWQRSGHQKFYMALKDVNFYGLRLLIDNLLVNTALCYKCYTCE
uniref:Uncharacterized protein n=1 Tax=Spironucleus salmonicida TaxID=348837 RepID=V6LLZ5_9EUKA|eukprot:EST41729.1 Hypothetical protein SS50377_18815 [Spironucleus salmonicida]